MKISIVLLISLALIQAAVGSKKPPGPIENIILLCMENHSYDNMLGFMEAPIGDLTGEEFNYVQPQLKKDMIKVGRGATFRTDPDPPHGFQSVNHQIYGKLTFPVDNSEETFNTGFAYSYRYETGGDPQKVMNIYTPDQVPIISTLARNFQVHKNWFCSVPTCTDPNKYFLYAAQSHGTNGNCPQWYCGEDYPLNMNTIFENVGRDDYSWSIHYMDWCEAMAVEPLASNVEKFVHDQDFDLFIEKIQTGNLDTLTYLVPRIMEGDEVYPYPNTQHPAEDIRAGEVLIKRVYEALRNSPYWEKSMLILTYDEHGGFWDSVPATKTVPNPYPESKGWPDRFDFDRLGVRVPSIIISPWVAHSVQEDTYDHATVPATIKSLLQLSSPYLTSRDAAAQHFVTSETLLSKPRKDCPLTLPDVSPTLEEYPLEAMVDSSDNNRPHTINQARILGSILVNRGVISLERYEFIVKEYLSKAENILHFLTEAKELLGYKQKIHNRQKFEARRFILPKEVDDGVEVVYYDS